MNVLTLFTTQAPILRTFFQMFGLEHWELDDKHLIVGNQNFSSVVLGLAPITLAPPQYVSDTPLRDAQMMNNDAHLW